MTHYRLALLLPSLLSLSGCPQPPPPATVDMTMAGCTTPFQGDPSQPIQLEIIYVDQSANTVALSECSDVEIVKPPQGGRVVFAGVRATNIDPCYAKLIGVLRAPDGSISGSGPDNRTVTLVPIAGRPGWVQSDPSGDLQNAGYAGFANLPLCPNYDPNDVQDRIARIEMTIKDRGDRTAVKSVTVVPRCRATDPTDEAQCYCLCSGNYTSDRCTDLKGWDAGSPKPICGDMK